MPQVDLNGDGKPEVIVPAPGGVLHVVAPRRHGDGFAKALLLAEVDLSTLIQLPATDVLHVVALRTGYLTPEPKELVRALRKQASVM